jgi:hypothetical protein
MNIIKKNPWPSLKFWFLAIHLKYQLVSSKQRHFIHTFEFVNLFPIKLCQVYFREELESLTRLPIEVLNLTVGGTSVLCEV